RASRCNDVQPSRRSARKACCFDGRSEELMRRAVGSRPARVLLGSWPDATATFMTPHPRRTGAKFFLASASRVCFLGYASGVMNRLTPAPPVGAPPRFPSGGRARLGRDPVPILLREGGPALVARVRRDLIDDEEAPGPAEVVTYPEVKAFLKKQEKNGAFPAKPPEKTLGSVKFARAVGTLRALEKLAEYGLGKAHPAVARAAELLLSSQAADGGIGDLALGETPESRTRPGAL